jgi:hypothetical protein
MNLDTAVFLVLALSVFTAWQAHRSGKQLRDVYRRVKRNSRGLVWVKRNQAHRGKCPSLIQRCTPSALRGREGALLRRFL